MRDIQAVLFDLDDTLLNRDEAVDNLFSIILEKCYRNVPHSAKYDMLQKFREYDKGSYGIGDKTSVVEAFFEEFPPESPLPFPSTQDFWNHYFPQCFSINPSTIEMINAIKQQAKVAIITNGSTHRQRAKIMNTQLDRCFDVIIISEEAGISKPDKRIFDLALHQLNVEPEAALFVGDNLIWDIDGSQKASMKGIWFNPQMKPNDTEIKPYAEIRSLEHLLSYFTQLA